MSKQLNEADAITGIWITRSPNQIIFSEEPDDELEIFANIEIAKERKKFSKVKLFADDETDPSQLFLGRLKFKNKPLQAIQDGKKEIGGYSINERGGISLDANGKLIALGRMNEFFLDEIGFPI